MQPTVVNKESFTIMGIAVQTTNQAEISGQGELPKLWERFFQEQVMEKIPEKLGHSLYGLYIDYEDGVNGLYTMVIGTEVKPETKQAEGLVVKHIPAAKYLVFTSEKGPVSQVVPEVWQRVWAHFEQSGEERTYTGDFERYDERCSDPMNSVVDVYVAIR